MPTNLSPLTATHHSTVTPDQIDELGHMNVRWYGANAVAGTHEVCDRLGLGQPALRSLYTRHHHEQLVGSELEVTSAVLAGGTGLRLYHELRNRADGQLAATFVHELDSAAPEGVDRLEELPEHGRPRSLTLGTDGLAAAPSLDEVRDRGLAMRLERTVTEEDSNGADVVAPWLLNNLLWGGERPDGEESWIRTLANGERYAWATMEARLWLSGPVPLGTRIQSFGALVARTDKITHDVAWVYDLDTGTCLAAMEDIDLCFNIDQRRSIAMPDDYIAMSEARFHPEYAVS